MDAGAGDLTGGVESFEVGAAVEIGADTTHGVVGGRVDRGGLARQVDTVL